MEANRVFDNYGDMMKARKKLLISFPGSYINSRDEFIAHPRTNQYFLLADCVTAEDIQAKVLEWLSRAAFKTSPYSQEWRNDRFHNAMRTSINAFLGTAFTEEDMETIYCKLGNRINHELTMDFILTGYDTVWLASDGETRSEPDWR